MSEWRELTWEDAMRRGYEALCSGEALYEEIDAEHRSSRLRPQTGGGRPRSGRQRAGRPLMSRPACEGARRQRHRRATPCRTSLVDPLPVRQYGPRVTNDCLT